jgi:hypothetical protein
MHPERNSVLLVLRRRNSKLIYPKYPRQLDFKSPIIAILQKQHLLTQLLHIPDLTTSKNSMSQPTLSVILLSLYLQGLNLLVIINTLSIQEENEMHIKQLENVINIEWWLQVKLQGLLIQKLLHQNTVFLITLHNIHYQKH